MSDSEPEDEFVDVTFSPPRKRLIKNHLEVQSKEIILNVYKWEMLEHPMMPVADLEKRVADKVGVGRSSVFKIIQEYKKTRTLSAPKKHRQRKSSLQTCDDSAKNAIRRIVHEFFFRNELPTIDKVLQRVNEDPGLPNFKRTTFYKFLKHINFKSEKRGRHSMIVDKDEIIIWRREYLEQIRRFRMDKRTIYFLDEAFFNDNSLGLKNQTGIMICHIGNEKGFVPDTLWAFQTKKSENSLEEMDCTSFENWFLKTLPTLDENCVIVLDSAPHHSRKFEKIPPVASKNSEIQDWLRAKGIHFDDSLIKPQLLAIVNQHKSTHNKYMIDEIAKNTNRTVLRLPPYHCELNPMELVWTTIRNHVTSKNRTLGDLLSEALAAITPQVWQNFVIRVRRQVEQKMWDLDDKIETRIEAEPSANVDEDSSSSFSE